ncbi:pentatricopeptide repeat-containing protein At1g03100, mitochondrial isoform X2 [Citrus clementina]|uniref:pentatricopeptide repeat-containing protein At1g03100, mitochondrial isoform X2 n=1 Tax=Citrus clementina TaxID=85681 RepID=UPI0003D704B0|nr:pentatricopeptide repeat-containing protein At1g03100, mitochondrial isoform X2 [Citrus x clementina]XP_024044168.1 pentatricopeptide repeat-containing protein At1g03100, mitochondrial isoform X2 [Citrus x clementina]
MWKVRRHFSASSSAILGLFNDSCQNAAWVSRHQIQSARSQWLGFEPILVRCYLTYLNMQTGVLPNLNEFTYPTHPFSSMGGTILVQARDPAKLSAEIENAINEHRYGDAWKLYEQHMQMDGFPRKTLVNKILTSFVESLDSKWLEKAYGLVEQAFEEGKQILLEKEPLIYLSLGLSKCGLPVPASTILRKLVATEQYPPVTAWSAILAHMSLTAPGAYLAAELILEIGYLFQDGRVDPRKKCNAPLIAMKPNTNTFNIALAGCLLFETTRKAEQLLDIMPRIGVKADSNLLIIMAHIYERNGRREELRKLQRHIDEAVNLSDIQFRQFYNCLLSCHLKFGDLNSASKMVLEMLQRAKEARNSLAAAMLPFNAVGVNNRTPSEQNVNCTNSVDLENSGIIENHILSYEDFTKDRKFVALEAEVKRVLQTLLGMLQKQVELITTEHGILQPTEKIYIKLVKAFLEAGKTKELTHFLIKAEKENLQVSHDDAALGHVITLCISLGWLDQAHDLLDEMHLAGVRASSSVYASLLKAYIEANRPREVTALLRDARSAGIQLDASCYEALLQSKIVQKDTPGALHLFKEMKESKIPRSGHQEFEMLVKGCAQNHEAGLMAKLLQEVKEGQRIDCGVHDWNNVIHFFCKKRLMQDAEKALKRMRSLGHLPNAQTFHSMVTGYAAIGGKYTEILRGCCCSECRSKQTLIYKALERAITQFGF